MIIETSICETIPERFWLIFESIRLIFGLFHLSFSNDSLWEEGCMSRLLRSVELETAPKNIPKQKQKCGEKMKQNYLQIIPMDSVLHCALNSADCATIRCPYCYVVHYVCVCGSRVILMIS